MQVLRPLFVLVLVLATGAMTRVAAATLPEGMAALPLVTITNDRDHSINRLELMVRGRTVRGLYLQTTFHAGPGKNTTENEVYWLADIESPDGVVLGQGRGHKAIIVQGRIASKAGTGSLVIHYLHNGLFHHYRQCRIRLKRVGRHRWQVRNAYNGDRIRHITVETWALGISTLAPVCPK